MQDIAAVVFDLDGTLVDSAPDLQAAANRMLADLDRPPLDLETVIGFIGHGVERLVRRCLARSGLDPDGAVFGDALARFRAHYDADLTARTRLYPGAEALILALARRGLPMAICTNKPEAPARRLCEALEIAPFFPVIVGGETAGARKPDPAPLLLAVERLSAALGRTLYVGDSETDYLTARRAGTPFAFFEGGYQRRPIPEFAPDLRVRSLAELGWLADPREGAGLPSG